MTSGEALDLRRSAAAEVSRQRRPSATLIVFAAYLLLAVLTVGWHAVSHLTSVCACVGTADPAFYMWALDWWPHAILTAHNPFFTHVLWVPTGVNIARAAAIPTAAILLAPVTALIGPVAAYNVLSLVSPATVALTAYCLCRRLARHEGAAFTGGLLFGFGAYEFSQLTGHLNLTLVALIPLAVLICMRRVAGEISRRRYVAYAAVLLIMQAGLSTELLATGLMMGGVTLLALRFFAEAAVRAQLKPLLLETLAAGAVAAIVLAPFLYYALISGGLPTAPPNISDAYGLDLLNPIIPTPIQLFGRHDFSSVGLTFELGNLSESGGYLTAPLVIAFLAWGLNTRERVLWRVLSVVVVVCGVAALGSHLHIAGQQTMSLPYNWLRDLPVFHAIIPSRLILYVALALSVGVSLWLAQAAPGRAGRWALVGLAVLLLVPNISSRLWGRPPSNPAFFRTGLHRQFLAAGESVLTLPYDTNDDSMLWQAEDGFSFVMPEGHVGAVPRPFAVDPVVAALVANTRPPSPAFGTFIRVHHVQAVVVDAAAAGPWPAAMTDLGFQPRYVGGVIVYRVPPLVAARPTGSA